LDFVYYKTPCNTRASLFFLAGSESGKPEFRSLDTWQDIADWYGRMVDQQALFPDTLRRLMEEAIGSARYPREVARRIVARTKKLINPFCSLMMSARMEHPFDPIQTVRLGWGVCRDFATFLVAAFRSFELPCFLVLVSTHCDSLPLPRPRESVFNHAIAMAILGGDTLFMDLTDPDAPFGALPKLDHHALALVTGIRPAVPFFLPAARGWPEPLQLSLASWDTVGVPRADDRSRSTRDTLGVDDETRRFMTRRKAEWLSRLTRPDATGKFIPGGRP
jgi:hypothetical protein